MMMRDVAFLYEGEDGKPVMKEIKVMLPARDVATLHVLKTIRGVNISDSVGIAVRDYLARLRADAERLRGEGAALGTEALEARDGR